MRSCWRWVEATVFKILCILRTIHDLLSCCFIDRICFLEIIRMWDGLLLRSWWWIVVNKCIPWFEVMVGRSLLRMLTSIITLSILLIFSPSCEIWCSLIAVWWVPDLIFFIVWMCSIRWYLFCIIVRRESWLLLHVTMTSSRCIFLNTLPSYWGGVLASVYLTLRWTFNSIGG